MLVPHPMKHHLLAAAFVAIAAALPARSAAQSLPFLDSLHVNAIAAEISGDAAYEHVRHMSQFHRPRGGSAGLWRVAQYVEQRAREFGLEDVQLIRQPYTARPWNVRFADLRIEGSNPERITSTLFNAVSLADYSRPTNVTAELVHVGAGTPAELDAAAVRGRIVLTFGNVNAVMNEAVFQRGALGVVWYPDPYSPANGISGAGVSRPDQVRWVTLPQNAVDGNEPTFAFVLSLRQGVDLRNRLAQSQTPVRVRAVIDSEFSSPEGDEPWQVMVEAFIRGTEPEAGQDVMMLGHMQEEQHSANDDASGVASTLEIGRALKKLIDEGRLPRPRRSIRMWWVTEFSSQRQYFADNPDSHRRMWVAVNQDMVGADQSQDILRKQNVTRVPATRFHFLNDVMEGVVEYMRTTNTFELAQLQNGIPLYPRPHLAQNGSMHRYNVEAIWFHENTDHTPFNEAPIGVPAISFTNMPDRFIHSNEDDLWNVDRTQLGRNAVSAALIAYTMAAADSAAFSALAAETSGRGAERMARNLRLALTWIATQPDAARAYHEGADQLRYAAERERLAVRSLAQMHPSAAPRVTALLEEIARRQAQAERELQEAHRRIAGRAAPGRPALSDVERQLQAMTPRLTAGPREFLTGRGRIGGVPGLHGLMASEVLSSIDGQRTGLNIYRYVAAEAREAGSHYYGTVTPERVLAYLQRVEAAGLAQLQ